MEFWRKTVPCRRTGNRKCPRANGYSVHRWNEQISRCGRTEVWSAGDHISISRITRRVYYLFSESYFISIVVVVTIVVVDAFVVVVTNFVAIVIIVVFGIRSFFRASTGCFGGWFPTIKNNKDEDNRLTRTNPYISIPHTIPYHTIPYHIPYQALDIHENASAMFLRKN